MSFRTRLALLLAVTLVAVQALTAAVAYLYLRHQLVERGKRELAAEMRVFTRQLDFLSERVTDAVKVSSLDYALRAAIAQHNRPTEISALRNHSGRIGAARMMLVGLNGALEVDTGSAPKDSARFRFPELLGAAAVNEQAATLAAIHGRIYWIVVVPVRAPVPIGFIAAFIPVDNALLARLRALSVQSRVVVLAAADSKGTWKVAAATSPGNTPHVLPHESGMLERASIETVDEGHHFLTAVARLETAKGSAPVIAAISYPLDEALAAYRSLLVPLLALLLLALVIAVAGTLAVVRGLARPLEQLAGAARRIAAGDYTPPPKLPQHDEIGHLAEALNHMAQSIADREAALRHALGSADAARDEAVRANRAKSQFLANMSHELRTPLNAILGFSELMEQQVLGPLAPRYAGYAHDIHRSAGSLLTVVDRMLDVADSESGQLKLARAPVCPLQLLDAVAAELKHLAQENRVRFWVQTPPSVEAEMEGDPARLKQAFTNLVHNGIRFTPPGGEVRVNCHAQAGLLSIEIADSGIGIAPDLLPTIVRPFQRLRSALDGQHQGAGLGLPFAKAVIELHGGRLELASEVGAGTTASIELPVRVSAVGQAA